MNSVLHLQHTIGNQAVLRLLQTNSEKRNAEGTSAAPPRSGRDSSPVPVQSPAAEARPTKLAINQPGDMCEEEADRISKHVMNTSAAQLQRNCACGANYSTRRTEQPGQQHDPLQINHVGSSDLGQIPVPSIIDEVLHSPGQSLDSTTRLFMERRFGHDFSKLRVHIDARAAESAQAIGAAAYTIGNDLIFDTGEFNPQNNESRRLIAHELTHVVQQDKGGRSIQKQPKKGRVVRVERPSKTRPQPPGPGTYTEAELRNWYSSHPDAKTKSVDMVNGKRTRADAYTPDALWLRGYFYALTNVFGNTGTEVWLNNEGKGKVIGVEREIP